MTDHREPGSLKRTIESGANFRFCYVHVMRVTSLPSHFLGKLRKHQLLAMGGLACPPLSPTLQTVHMRCSADTSRINTESTKDWQHRCSVCGGCLLKTPVTWMPSSLAQKLNPVIPPSESLLPYPAPFLLPASADRLPSPTTLKLPLLLQLPDILASAQK